MSKSLSRALLRSSSLIILISSSVLLAPSSFASDPLEVVVTADRSEVPLKNTGSAITVITSEEIEKFGSKNIADVLRTVPGLMLNQSGGLGTETKIQLRGASPSGSMVLIDGIRISDPSNTEGYFDLGNFSAANIDRIEVLRGPQSALYGSDAMGGVINIITKKGRRAPMREVNVEAGSYGTYSARGSMSGATDVVSYAFGMNTLYSEGFPRYGYRNNSPDLFPQFIGNTIQPTPKNDPTSKFGVNGNVSYRMNDDITLETGLTYFVNSIQVDNPYAYTPENVYNSGNRSNAEVISGYVKNRFSAFDGRLKNQITAFANQTNLNNWQSEGGCSDFFITDPCRSGYIGSRLGLEYQGDFNLDRFGLLIFGLRHETELAQTNQVPVTNFNPVDVQQSTNSAFAQNRYRLSEQADISIGGRVDAIENGSTFITWRSTANYRFDDIGTKLRASVGTGAKAPTLFQRFTLTGTPDLLPETSFGYDIGFDKAFLNGGVILSGTYFDNAYSNKITYRNKCFLDPKERNCYYNIGEVKANGVEISANIELVPSQWSAKLSYTIMSATDNDGKQLYKLPQRQGALSIIYYASPKIEIEPRLTYVGDRVDVNFGSGLYQDVTLPAYLKLDFMTRYKLDELNDAYVRFENLTNVHTEDVYLYGSAGRSVYVGWTSRW